MFYLRTRGTSTARSGAKRFIVAFVASSVMGSDTCAGGLGWSCSRRVAMAWESMIWVLPSARVTAGIAYGVTADGGLGWTPSFSNSGAISGYSTQVVV